MLLFISLFFFLLHLALSSYLADPHNVLVASALVCNSSLRYHLLLHILSCSVDGLDDVLEKWTVPLGKGKNGEVVFLK